MTLIPIYHFLNIFKNIAQKLNSYLPWSCTPTNKDICEHQNIKWYKLKQELLGQANPDIHTNFQYFVKKEIEKKGKIKKQLVAESKSVNVHFTISFIDDLLTKIVHPRNLLKNFRTVYPLVLESLSTTELCVDFSENLTLTLPQEIQSMYWGQAKRVVTVHTCLLRRKCNKQYHPYFSDDLVHNQWFVLQPLKRC